MCGCRSALPPPRRPMSPNKVRAILWRSWRRDERRHFSFRREFDPRQRRRRPQNAPFAPLAPRSADIRFCPAGGGSGRRGEPWSGSWAVIGIPACRLLSRGEADTAGACTGNRLKSRRWFWDSSSFGRLGWRFCSPSSGSVNMATRAIFSPSPAKRPRVFSRRSIRKPGLAVRARLLRLAFDRQCRLRRMARKRTRPVGGGAPQTCRSRARFRPAYRGVAPRQGP